MKLENGQTRMVTKVTRPTGELQIGSGEPIMMDIAEFTTWIAKNTKNTLTAAQVDHIVKSGDKVTVTIDILDDDTWAAKKKEGR